MSDDDEFSAQRPSVRRAIDAAFSKLSSSSEGIPLVLVPRGLQMLDLAPDDEQVLEVFRNAATGWENRGRVETEAGLTVSRDDWRAVCAVLLGQQDEPDRKKRKTSIEPERRVTRAAAKKQPDSDPDLDSDGGGFLAESSGESDVYLDQPDESSESEFGALPQGRIACGEEPEPEVPRTLTVRQEREARLAFALFFPGMDAEDPALNTKKLGVEEVKGAARTLREELSNDDIGEMLRMFGSGEGIGLEEFGRMAVMAQLV